MKKEETIEITENKKEKHMKRIIAHHSKFILGLAALVFTLSIGAGVAFAAIQCNQAKGGCDASTDQNGNLIITYNITGLGNTSVAGWVVNVTVEGHARCKNSGDNCPSAANKFGDANQSVTGEFRVRNGNASGTITITPQTGLNCPGKQNPVIIDVSYTQITLTVEGTEVFVEAGPENANPNSCPL
jgi:hypothetical protein